LLPYSQLLKITTCWHCNCLRDAVYQRGGAAYALFTRQAIDSHSRNQVDQWSNSPRKKTMTSLAFLEDRQAEVLSGGLRKFKVSVGNKSNNSGNANGDITIKDSNFQIGSTYTEA
jgi:hypothetical protein